MLVKKANKIFIENQKQKIFKYLFSNERMNRNVLENSIFNDKKIKTITISAFVNGEAVDNDNIFKYRYMKNPRTENIKDTLTYEKIKDKKRR